jgi:ketosteroid isomerase-like protein
VATPNEELVFASMEAFNAGDVPAVLETTDPEVVWEPRRALVQGAYRGHDGMRAFFADNAESFEKFKAVVEEVRDLGDGRVLVFGTLHILARGSRIETDIPIAGISEIRDGLMIRWKDYGDRAAALAAAELDSERERDLER